MAVAVTRGPARDRDRHARGVAPTWRVDADGPCEHAADLLG
jgi:hypothetical protein